MAEQRSESGQEMTLTDTAKSRKSVRSTVPVRRPRCLIEPFAHQVRRHIGKVIAGHRLGRIGAKVDDAPVRTDFDNILDLFFYSFHRVKQN